jgi:NAD(P)-dependent dehydrogenase (short-subunit alcohol dehydrogenase family)
VDLSGKVALVTGGGYGMGRASACLFAASGASVVIADIDPARARETVDLCDGEASAFECDVSDADQVAALMAFVVETYGGLDLAHNNAGIIGPQYPVHDYPRRLWDHVIATNLTAVFLCMQAEIPLMLARGGGAIVNVASETTYKGNVGDIAYTASKHGVVGLTTVAGLQYVRRGIRVNCVAPGNVETGITEGARAVLTPAQVHAMETAQPLGRISQPEEIAEIVVWLCSDGAALINATRIAADTGWHVS